MDPIIFLKDYQTLITGIVTSIVLLVGLTLTYKQIVYMKKDRHSDLVMNLTAKWDSDLISKSRKSIVDIENNNESLCKKLEEYEKSNPEHFLTLFRVGNYFEHMGWLIDKGYIEEPHLVIDLFKSSIIHYYDQYEEYILKQREKEEEDGLYKYFEKLARTAKAR